MAKNRKKGAHSPFPCKWFEAEEVNMDVDTVLGVEKMMDIDPPCKWRKFKYEVRVGADEGQVWHDPQQLQALDEGEYGPQVRCNDWTACYVWNKKIIILGGRISKKTGCLVESSIQQWQMRDGISSKNLSEILLKNWFRSPSCLQNQNWWR